MKKLSLIIAALLWAAPFVMADPCPCAGGTEPLTKTCGGGGTANACADDDCCGDLGIAPTAGWECCGDEEFDPSVDECCEDLTINPIGECDDGDSIWIVGDGYVGVGGVVNLAVGTEGSGSSPTYQWTLVQGGGSLSDTSGESVTLTVGSSTDYYEIKVEDTQSNEVAHHSVQSVRVWMAFNKNSVCDGESLDAELKILPSSLISEVSDPDISLKPVDSANDDCDNPDSSCSIIVPTSDISQWWVPHVYWYEHSNEPCRTNNSYKAVGTVDVGGVAITLDDELGSFSADAGPGCVDGFAGLVGQPFSGEPVYSSFESSEYPGTWYGQVSVGTFKRDVKAEYENNTDVFSQFWDMIELEETFHAFDQFENKEHPVFKECWKVEEIMVSVNAAAPYPAQGANAAIIAARNAFSNAREDEMIRSNEYYAVEKLCDVECEAKEAARSKYVCSVKCTYENCFPCN